MLVAIVKFHQWANNGFAAFCLICEVINLKLSQRSPIRITLHNNILEDVFNEFNFCSTRSR
ncbi:hypothetical protein VIOR103205_01770 [Vibrio ordalii]